MNEHVCVYRQILWNVNYQLTTKFLFKMMGWKNNAHVTHTKVKCYSKMDLHHLRVDQGEMRFNLRVNNSDQSVSELGTSSKLIWTFFKLIWTSFCRSCIHFWCRLSGSFHSDMSFWVYKVSFVHFQEKLWSKLVEFEFLSSDGITTQLWSNVN